MPEKSPYNSTVVKVSINLMSIGEVRAGVTAVVMAGDGGQKNQSTIQG